MSRQIFVSRRFLFSLNLSARSRIVIASSTSGSNRVLKHTPQCFTWGLSLQAEHFPCRMRRSLRAREGFMWLFLIFSYNLFSYNLWTICQAYSENRSNARGPKEIRKENPRTPGKEKTFPGGVCRRLRIKPGSHERY